MQPPQQPERRPARRASSDPIGSGDHRARPVLHIDTAAVRAPSQPQSSSSYQARYDPRTALASARSSPQPCGGPRIRRQALLTVDQPPTRIDERPLAPRARADGRTGAAPTVKQGGGVCGLLSVAPAPGRVAAAGAVQVGIGDPGSRAGPVEPPGGRIDRHPLRALHGRLGGVQGRRRPSRRDWRTRCPSRSRSRSWPVRPSPRRCRPPP